MDTCYIGLYANAGAVRDTHHVDVPGDVTTDCEQTAPEPWTARLWAQYQPEHDQLRPLSSAAVHCLPHVCPQSSIGGQNDA